MSRSTTALPHTADEKVVRFLRYTSTSAPDHFLLFLEMYLHGLNIHDVCALAVSDVNLRERKISIRRHTESGTPTGKISLHPLSREEASLLAEHLGRLPAEATTLFATPEGKPYTALQVVQHYQESLAAAGLPSRKQHPAKLIDALCLWLLMRGHDTEAIGRFCRGQSVAPAAQYQAPLPESQKASPASPAEPTGSPSPAGGLTRRRRARTG